MVFFTTPRQTLYKTIQTTLKDTKELPKPYTLTLFPPKKEYTKGTTNIQIDVSTHKNIRKNLVTKLKLSILDEHEELDEHTNERVRAAIGSFGQGYYMDVDYHTHPDLSMPSQGFRYMHYDDSEFFLRPSAQTLKNTSSKQETSNYIDQQLLLQNIYPRVEGILPPQNTKATASLYAAPAIYRETTKDIYETLLTIAPHFQIDTKGMYQEKEFRIAKQTTQTRKERVDQILTLQPSKPSYYAFWGGVKPTDVDDLEAFLHEHELLDLNKDWLVKTNHAKDF